MSKKKKKKEYRWLFDPNDDQAESDRCRLWEEARCMMEGRPYVAYSTGESLIPEGEEKDPWMRYRLKGYTARDIANVFQSALDSIRETHFACERMDRNSD